MVFFVVVGGRMLHNRILWIQPSGHLPASAHPRPLRASRCSRRLHRLVLEPGAEPRPRRRRRRWVQAPHQSRSLLLHRTRQREPTAKQAQARQLRAANKANRCEAVIFPPVVGGFGTSGGPRRQSQDVCAKL